VRGRIEVILDWAKVSGYRTGENPARWRGHTDNLLPAKSTVRKVVHHAALPYREVGAFLVDLRQREGVAARALEFTILCATRTGDVIGNDRDDKPPMRRSHVNFRDRVWTIPSTKTGAEHRVPLSTAAMALLAKMGDGEADDLMFPGMAGEPLSNASMASVIERMNDDRTARGLARYVDRKQGNRDVTVHGFRSTFEDWALDTTSFPEIVTDMALAHKIDDKVKAAYLRSDLFEKRRRLMVQWATFCNKSKSVTRGKVVPLRRA
jgi:integrase